MAPLTTVAGRLLLETPCATETTVWLLAGFATNTGWLVTGSAARAVIGRLVTVLAAGTVGFLLLAGSAVHWAGAGIIPAVTAALTVVLLTGWADALARETLAGVATPWAGVCWSLADLAAAAVFFGLAAPSTAATRVVLD